METRPLGLPPCGWVFLILVIVLGIGTIVALAAFVLHITDGM